MLNTRHNSKQPRWKLDERIYWVSGWYLHALTPLPKKQFKPTVYRLYMYVTTFADKSKLPRYKDHSRNPISSSKIICFQGGSACQCTTNAKRKVHAIFLQVFKTEKKKITKQTKPEPSNDVIMLTTVAKI